MTRKDYISLAEALRYARGHAMAGTAVTEALASVTAAAELIANVCKNDNPAFDREHFLAVVRGDRDINSRPRKFGK